MAIKLKQTDLPDINVDTVINPNTHLQVVCINQDGKTIFLEHSKIVEFLKTVNNFK